MILCVISVYSSTGIAVEVCAMDEQRRKEHHGREYLIGAIGALSEYLAVKYEVGWLAWLAAFLLFLAIFEYVSNGSVRWKPGPTLWVALAVAVIIGTYFVTRRNASLHDKTQAVAAAPASVQTAQPAPQQPPSAAPGAKPPEMKAGRQSARTQGNGSPAGNIDQSGSAGNTAVIGNNNEVGNTYVGTSSKPLFTYKIERVTIALGGVSLTNSIESIRRPASQAGGPLNYRGYR
jgi:hypothetical protein